MSDSIRLHKRIASSGYCSRREAEELMRAGQVKVNGRTVTKMGSKVKASDTIVVRGETLSFSQERLTVMLHKPAGYVTSKRDPHNPKTVMDLVPKDLQHLNPVGRLDKPSEGLLLLTTDGALLEQLTHPKFNHSKTYEVIVKGHPKEKNLYPMTTGRFKLEEHTLKPMQFTLLGSPDKNKTRIRLVLTEGRKRQIRRVMEELGFPVLYLKRIAIGELTLGDLPKGEFRPLTEAEIQSALS